MFVVLPQLSVIYRFLTSFLHSEVPYFLFHTWYALPFLIYCLFPLQIHCLADLQLHSPQQQGHSQVLWQTPCLLLQQRLHGSPSEYFFTVCQFLPVILVISLMELPFWYSSWILWISSNLFASDSVRLSTMVGIFFTFIRFRNRIGYNTSAFRQGDVLLRSLTF